MALYKFSPIALSNNVLTTEHFVRTLSIKSNHRMYLVVKVMFTQNPNKTTKLNTNRSVCLLCTVNYISVQSHIYKVVGYEKNI